MIPDRLLVLKRRVTTVETYVVPTNIPGIDARVRAHDEAAVLIHRDRSEEYEHITTLPINQPVTLEGQAAAASQPKEPAPAGEKEG